MVKFVDTDFSGLTPGQTFTIKWDYEYDTSEEARVRGVLIDFQLRSFGNAASRHIWLGDSQGNGNPGVSYDWEVPVNIPHITQVATAIISEVSQSVKVPSTTAFVFTNAPSATGLNAVSLPFCTDDAASNCITVPSSATFVPSINVSSIADPTSSFDSTPSTTPTTLVTSPLNAPLPTPTPTSLPASTDRGSSHHALPASAAIGIGIGSVFAFIIIAVVGFFFYKYGKRRALAKDNTTEYSNGWSASGGGNPDANAEHSQKAGEGGDFRKAELDATPTPAPAYSERLAGSGNEGVSGVYVQPDDGHFRAELVGSTDWGVQPAPMTKNGGELVLRCDPLLMV